MTQLDAILRTIRENPDDDLPRKVLADCLEEHDQAARAEYIRASLDYFACGPEHKVLKGRTTLLRRGEGYWEVRSADDLTTWNTLEEGDRVDVNLAGKAKHGLRVKITTHGSGTDFETREVVLIRDAKSKPREDEPHRSRMEEAWASRDPSWTHPFVFNAKGSLSNVTEMTMVRGLVDRVQLRIGQWDRLADEVRDPVRRVCLEDVAPLRDPFSSGVYAWFRGAYAWFHEDVPGDTYSTKVPARIHVALKGWMPWLGRREQSPCKRYESREAAFEAMTAALRSLWPWVEEWAQPSWVGPVR